MKELDKSVSKKYYIVQYVPEDVMNVNPAFLGNVRIIGSYHSIAKANEDIVYYRRDNKGTMFSIIPKEEDDVIIIKWDGGVQLFFMYNGFCSIMSAKRNIDRMIKKFGYDKIISNDDSYVKCSYTEEGNRYTDVYLILE